MRLLTLIAGTSLLLTGCGKKEDAPAKTPTPSVAAPRPAPLRLTATANRKREATVTAGWAVVVEARLALQPGAEALTLNPPTGAWSEALRLECKGPDGVDRAALFKPAFVSEKSIDLTPQRSGRKVWVLDAVALSEGTYSLRIVMDGAALGVELPPGGLSAWVVLQVAAAPAAETPAETQAKVLARMSASSWSGDVTKSLAAADEHLAAHPKDVAVGFKKGQVLRAEGRTAEALAAFETTLRWAEEQREPDGENVAIVRVIQDLRRELRAK